MDILTVKALQELETLLKKRESTTLEFKSRIDNPYKIARTIVAFANTSGGIALVGINDDKTVKGISALPEIEKLQKALELIEPPLEINYEIVMYQEKRKVLIINVKESLQKPHTVLNAKNEKEVFVRADDATVPASKQMIQILERFDTQPNNDYVNQPNIKKLTQFLQKNRRITVKQFAKLVNISDHRAEKTMQELVFRGYLLMLDTQRPVSYVLKK
ncbi:MAG: helix-turn-helix domain-containing protein [Spirosomataceae bacterium]